MAASDLQEGKLSVTRERMWGLYKRPHEPIAVKLPADPVAKAKYIAKGFTFIRYGGDELPIAEPYMTDDVLKSIAPVKKEVAVETITHSVAVETPESVVTAIGEPELYVSDKPYKPKRKAKRKSKNTS